MFVRISILFKLAYCPQPTVHDVCPECVATVTRLAIDLECRCMALLDDASRLGRVASLARQGQAESRAAVAAADAACVEVRGGYMLHTYPTTYIKPCGSAARAPRTSFISPLMLHLGWLAGKQRILPPSSKPFHWKHCNTVAGGG
jgi:hypothetical protein